MKDGTDTGTGTNGIKISRNPAPSLQLQHSRKT